MGAKTTGKSGNKFTDRLLLLAACAYQYSLEGIESCWYTSPPFSGRRAQGQYVRVLGGQSIQAKKTTQIQRFNQAKPVTSVRQWQLRGGKRTGVRTRQWVYRVMWDYLSKHNVRGLWWL